MVRFVLLEWTKLGFQVLTHGAGYLLTTLLPSYPHSGLTQRPGLGAKVSALQGGCVQRSVHRATKQKGEVQSPSTQLLLSASCELALPGTNSVH